MLGHRGEFVDRSGEPERRRRQPQLVGGQGAQRLAIGRADELHHADGAENPYVYPDNDLSYPGNFLSMLFKMENTFEPDPRLAKALEGAVPVWTWAIGDTRLEKRV